MAISPSRQALESRPSTGLQSASIHPEADAGPAPRGAGLNLPEVSLISGHQDPKMLFKYNHISSKYVLLKLSLLTAISIIRYADDKKFSQT
jgi:hypothetical protein